MKGKLLLVAGGFLLLNYCYSNHVEAIGMYTVVQSDSTSSDKAAIEHNKAYLDMLEKKTEDNRLIKTTLSKEKKLPKLQKDNYLMIGMGAFGKELKIIGLGDIDFHDNGNRAHFWIEIVDNYGQKEEWRVAKIKGTDEIKVMLAPSGRKFLGSDIYDEVNTIRPIDPNLAKILDIYVWSKFKR
ncbi:hypothetical protein [uncultured Veillonella sp.]|uniref:hypothetical protein n=1 Tax=uncultured Veillonella sp. TaxID=159268 RepID=UPI00258A3C0F|nr:hypothetical protein [uncultured Veillonella sp.]